MTIAHRFQCDGTLVLVLLLATMCDFCHSVIVWCYICSILMLTGATAFKIFNSFQYFSEFSLVMDLLLSETKTILFYSRWKELLV
jgi:hypothetical protein